MLLCMLVASLSTILLGMNELTKDANIGNDYSVQKIILKKALTYNISEIIKTLKKNNNNLYISDSARSHISRFSDNSQDFVSSIGNIISVWTKNKKDPVLTIETLSRITALTTTKDKKIIVTTDGINSLTGKQGLTSLQLYDGTNGNRIFKIINGNFLTTHISYSESLRECALLKPCYGIELYSLNKQFKAKEETERYIPHEGHVEWDATGKKLITGYNPHKRAKKQKKNHTKLYMYDKSTTKKTFAASFETNPHQLSVSSKNMLAACYPTKIDIYDIQKESLIKTIAHEDDSIQFDPTGLYLAVVERYWFIEKKELLTVWDMHSGKEIGVIKLNKPARSIEWIDNGMSIIVNHGKISISSYREDTQENLVRYNLTYALSEDFFGKDNEIVVRATTEGMEIEKLNK